MYTIKGILPKSVHTSVSKLDVTNRKSWRNEQNVGKKKISMEATERFLAEKLKGLPANVITTFMRSVTDEVLYELCKLENTFLTQFALRALNGSSPVKIKIDVYYGDMCIKGRRLVPTETFLECTNDDISRRIMAIFQPIELHLNDYELFKLRPKIRECLSSSRITFYTSRSITATPKLDYIIEKIVIADPILRYTGYTEIDYMNEVAAMKYFKKNKFRVPGIRRYGRFNAFHIVDFQAYSKYFPHLVAFDCSDIPIPWERYRELPKQLKSLTIQLITPASPVDDKIVSEFPSGLQELKLLSDNWNPCKSTIDLGNLKELQKQNLIFTNARVDYPSCIQEIQISLKIYPGSDQFRFLRFDQLINNLHYHVHLRILHLHIFCSYSSHSGYLGLENECFTGTNVTLPTHLMELSIVGDYHFKFTTEIQLPSNLVTLKLSQVKIGNLTEYKFPQNLKLLELSSIVHDISVDETEVFYGTNLLSSLTAFWHKRKRSQRA